jgi:hypothetical protein
MILAWFAIALTSAFLAALFFFPALALERQKRAVVLAGLAAPIALSPLWIPSDAPLVRLLTAMNATALLVRLYDLHVAASRSPPPAFSDFVAFLPNCFSVVWRRLVAEPEPTFRQNLARLGQSLWKTTAGAGFLVWLFHRDWSGTPFVVEHCAKTVAFFLALIPGSALAGSLWRLAGGRGLDFMAAPLLAPTPAEFWRRYNRPAQQFFYEDVFKRAGAFRSPVRATLVTFAVSALVHEYVFGVSLGHIQGYQTLFFMLQGLGVAVTVRLRPAGWRVWLWIGATWIFNLATSLFFFASVNGVFPFYSRGLPGWLAGW